MNATEKKTLKHLSGKFAMTKLNVATTRGPLCDIAWAMDYAYDPTKATCAKCSVAWDSIEMTFGRKP